MREQDEPSFADTPEGANALALLDAMKEGMHIVVTMLSDFPKRFEDPVLHEEALAVSQAALHEFTASMRVVAEKRVANRRQ